MPALPHQHISEDHVHQYESGKIVLPLSNGGHTVATLHDGYSLRMVSFERARIGQPPMLPKAVTEAGETLWASTVALPVPTSDEMHGTLLFSASGSYSYVSDEPRIPGENALPTGAYPLVDVTAKLAQTQVESAVKKGYITLTRPETQAEYDAMVDGLFNAVTQDTPAPQWRFTMFPTQFFSDTIQG